MSKVWERLSPEEGANEIAPKCGPVQPGWDNKGSVWGRLGNRILKRGFLGKVV